MPRKRRRKVFGSSKLRSPAGIYMEGGVLGVSLNYGTDLKASRSHHLNLQLHDLKAEVSSKWLCWIIPCFLPSLFYQWGKLLESLGIGKTHKHLRYCRRKCGGFLNFDLSPPAWSQSQCKPTLRDFSSSSGY